MKFKEGDIICYKRSFKKGNVISLITKQVGEYEEDESEEYTRFRQGYEAMVLKDEAGLLKSFEKFFIPTASEGKFSLVDNDV